MEENKIEDSKEKKELLELLHHLEGLLRRYHVHSYRSRGPLGTIHRGQGRILALLKLKPEISQKELGSILDIRLQSLGELLAKLERSGFIVRYPSEEDRRVLMIQLTEAGKQVASETDNIQEDFDLFDCLEADEQDILRIYLLRIIEKLENHLSDKEEEFQAGRGHSRHGENKSSHHRHSHENPWESKKSRGPRGEGFHSPEQE